MVRQTLMFFFQFAWPYRWRLITGFLLVAFTAQVTALIPGIVKNTLDQLEHQRGTLSPSAAESLLLGGAVGVVVCAALVMTGMFWMRWQIIVASRLIEVDIRRAFYDQLQRLSFLTMNAQRTGDLMSRATSDIEGVRMMCGPAIMHLSYTLCLLPTVVAHMLDISPLLTAAAFVPLVTIVFLVRGIGGQMYKLTQAAQKSLGDVSTKAQENFAGVRVIRAFAQDEAESANFGKVSAHYRDLNLQLSQTRGLFQAIVHTVANLGVLMFILLTPLATSAGGLTFASAIAFFAYQELLIWPIMAIGWTTMILQRGMASTKRLKEILDLRPTVAEPKSAVSLPTPIRGEIEFDRVSFRYRPEGPDVLRDLTFRIRPGQTVAFMGPIGSGKTTLARLIPRLFDPTHGTVRIDGRDLREWPLIQLREAIGYAPQDSFLFSESIAYNIAFGVPRLMSHGEMSADERAAIRRRVEIAGRVAQLERDVAGFTHGYDEVIGERGVTLSGGQKQRVALARALMIDPRILILDDSFSAVDTDTEERILAGLKTYLGQRTTLVIAHRVSTVRDADWIGVLKDGQLVEQGTDAELMARGGYYADLAAKQRLQAEVEAL